MDVERNSHTVGGPEGKEGTESIQRQSKIGKAVAEDHMHKCARHGTAW